MIIYTLGTIFFPFERAVNWLQVLLEEEIIVEPVILQHGATSAARLNHPLLTNVTSMPRNEMHQAVQQATLVISHAGQGSTRMLTELGASFVLLPRLKRYGEHVDDHQLLFARALEKYGVHHSTELDQLINYVKRRPSSFHGELLKGPLLVEHLIQRYSSLELRR